MSGGGGKGTVGFCGTIGFQLRDPVRQPPIRDVLGGCKKKKQRHMSVGNVAVKQLCHSL